MSEILTYAIGSLAAFSALYILITSNILHAAFSLVVTLLPVAILYFLAGAEFVGVTQIMIYVGGIIVLMIFGVMLTNEQRSREKQSKNHNKLMAFLLSGAIFGALFYSILKLNLSALSFGANSTLRDIGIALMSDYVLPFELAALLLLLVLIAAAVIASKREEIS